MNSEKILQIGNPLLRTVSEPCLESEFGTSELKKFSDRMLQIMSLEKGIGLAAPQLGVNKRAIVFGMDIIPGNNHIKPISRITLFNPSFEKKSDLCVEDYEGCLSVKSLRGKVSRYKSIYYRGFDVDGKLIEGEAFDLHARVIQHEIDHLNGIIFLDKISDHQSVGFYDELIAAGTLLPRQASQNV